MNNFTSTLEIYRKLRLQHTEKFNIKLKMNDAVVISYPRVYK